MRTADEIRHHLIERVNGAVRRPGMWGGELALRSVLADLTFVDDVDEAWRGEQRQLVERGSWTQIGVGGAFATVFGGRRTGTHDAAVGSVYAEVAHRLGYLRLDEDVEPAAYRALRREVRPWCRETDRTLTDVVAAFGEPGLRCGSADPLWPTTVAYGTDRPADPLVCFDTAGPTAVVRDVRIRTSAFPRDFTYTPAGRAMRHRTDYPLESLRSAPLPR